MKERLVELLKASSKAIYEEMIGSSCDEQIRIVDKTNELKADYLITNGVIVLPINFGQEFYYIEKYQHHLCPKSYPTIECICKGNVEHFYIDKFGGHFDDERKNFGFLDIGKTVFLTKEEAEQKLKERDSK